MNAHKVIVAALLLCGCSVAAFGQNNIAEARNNFSVGQTVTVSGIVTSDSELGPVRYLQDATAGIALYPPGGGWASLGFGFTPSLGDSITITGVLTEFANLLEIGPEISAMTLESTGHELPEPLVLTPGQFGEVYEGMLVAVDGAEFEGAGGTFGSSTYAFTASGQEGVVYIPATSPLIGELIPAGQTHMTGILSQHSYNNPNAGYQLLPRTGEDLVSENAINFTSEVDQTELSTSGFRLSWSTDLSSSSYVWYGTDPSLGETAGSDDQVTDHTVLLEGLEAGTPYYCRIFSVSGEDTAFSPIRVYSTVSESSGDIFVYFNRSVDHSVATGAEAVALFQATDDTVIAQIDRAMATLDIAMYNINSNPIVQAINDALDRGVTVRYIAEGQNANTALANLDPSIPVLYRQNATSSGMHNKFLIIDRDDVDNATVLTGSTNFTSNNLFSDPNNIVIVKDQALARAYTLEFNEMWGGSGPMHNWVTSRFGEFKTNNTPEKFIIGGRPVELYFSPTDNTTQAIVRAVESADYDLDFALMLITNNLLAEAIAGQVNFFLQPRGVVENIDETGSDFQFLLDAGVSVVQHGPDPMLHHKYAIVDHSQPLADPLVVTGSHNWSSSAESTNDENTLIIHDAEIANLFFQEFMARYGESTVSTRDGENGIGLALYPNPASEVIHVEFENPRGEAVSFTMTTVEGKIVASGNLHPFAGRNKLDVSVSELPRGIYILSVEVGDAVNAEKVVVGR